MEPGDTIIDGGNTYYRDDIRHAERLRERGIHHVDCGTSGGVWGLERGYCLMIGGETEAVERLSPIFAIDRPRGRTRPRARPGADGEPSPSEQGYLHCGPNGRRPLREDGPQRHRVRADGGVRRGVEHHLRTPTRDCTSSSRTPRRAPLENPEHYRYEIDTTEVAEVWRRGSVIGSWLLDLTAQELLASPELEEFAGRVSDSGEGRWTSIAAIEEGVPAPVLSAALYSRFASRDLDEYANKVQSAMRKGFGGHDEKPS